MSHSSARTPRLIVITSVIGTFVACSAENPPDSPAVDSPSAAMTTPEPGATGPQTNQPGTPADLGSGGSSEPDAPAAGGSENPGPENTAGGTGGAEPALGGAGGQAMAAPPAGVPADYTLVYDQNFKDPASADDFVFANPTKWAYSAEGYLETSGPDYTPPHSSPRTIALVNGVQVGSFVMDVEVQQTSPAGDAHRDLCLFWGFVSPSQFYYVHVAESRDEVAHNIHIVNEAPRTAITTQFTAGFDWGRDVWRNLRVMRDVETGDMQIFDLTAPDIPMLSANDKTFSAGYLGVGSFDNSGRVRNIRVWAPTTTDTPIQFGPPWGGVKP